MRRAMCAMPRKKSRNASEDVCHGIIVGPQWSTAQYFSSSLWLERRVGINRHAAHDRVLNPGGGERGQE